MKRKLLLLASLFLSLGVVGCSNNPAPESKGNEVSDSGSMPSYDGGSSTSENKTSIDDATTSKENMKSEAEIKAAIGSVFKISADSLPSGTPSTSASDGTYH